MTSRISYRLETPFSPTECCELLKLASTNQASVRMAPNWIHAPHVVLGKIEADGMRIYHAGQIEDPDMIYLCAEIVPNGAGSAIIGDFRRGKFQLFWLNLAQFIITFILLGFLVLIAYGVWKDASTSFTLPSIVVTVLPVVVWFLSLHQLKKWTTVSPNDTLVVREFIERATQTQNIEETEQDAALKTQE